jgi:hypothetical protein
MSSDYMAHVLAGGPKCEPAYPHDSSDFGRCSRFLRAVPTARKHLPKMATCGAVWAEYVKQWSVMEGYLASESTTGKCPKLNAMMHDIQDAARKAAP